MSEPALTLLAGGQVYAGWKQVRVVRSMQHCANSFELSLAERWSGQEVRLPVRPGTRCEVMVGENTVITGHVDGAEVSHDATKREVSVAGRDVTADLVDCSAVRSPGQWRGAKVEAIAADLCKPFAVRVRAEVDTGKPLASFALQAGESVFEAIARAARIRGLLLVSDSAGALVLTRAGVRRCATALVLGQNVKHAKARLDMRDRYSSYTVLGQAPGSDYYNGPQVSQMRSTATDPGVTRHRPLVMTNVEPDVALSLKDRVLWEANVRAAASVHVEVTVQGWQHAAGLWEPNMLVAVRLPSMDIDDELLITDAEYSLDDNGTTCDLTLTRSDAFKVLPLKASGGDKPYWSLK